MEYQNRKLLQFLPERMLVVNENRLVNSTSPELVKLRPFSPFLQQIIESNRGYILSEANLTGFKPIDSCVGKILHIAIGYTTESTPQEINAFNKIYSDLIVKLCRATSNHSKQAKKTKLRISAISEEHLHITLKIVNQSIINLAYFTGDSLDTSTTFFDSTVDNEADTFWMQDAFLVLKKSDVTGINIHLLENKSKTDKGRTPASFFANQFSNQISNVRDNEDDFCFSNGPYLPEGVKGGNVLFTTDCKSKKIKALVGINALEMGQKLSSGGWDNNDPDILAFKCNFSKLTGVEKKNIILLGSKTKFEMNQSRTCRIGWLGDQSGWQPCMHLDLFITPAGFDKNGKYRLVIGKPCQNGIQDPPQVFFQSKSEIETIAEILGEQGYALSYIPMPLTYVDTIKNGQEIRNWVLASYNNAIVQYSQDDQSSNFILIPTYSGDYSTEESYKIDEKQNYIKCGDWSNLKSYEYKVEKHWKSLGFRTFFLTDYLPLIILRGSAHCITKVLNRV